MLMYTYTFTGVPVGTPEFILVLRISNCTTEFILIFQILSWSYGIYTCIMYFIRVLQNLYMYFRSYMYITELIFVYMTYSCLTDLILVL